MVDDNGLEPLTLRTSNIEAWMNKKLDCRIGMSKKLLHGAEICAGGKG